MTLWIKESHVVHTHMSIGNIFGENEWYFQLKNYMYHKKLAEILPC